MRHTMPQRCTGCARRRDRFRTFRGQPPHTATAVARCYSRVSELQRFWHSQLHACHSFKGWRRRGLSFCPNGRKIRETTDSLSRKPLALVYRNHPQQCPWLPIRRKPGLSRGPSAQTGDRHRPQQPRVGVVDQYFAAPSGVRQQLPSRRQSHQYAPFPVNTALAVRARMSRSPNTVQFST